MQYKLLQAFQSLFEGRKYEHRKSHLGDYVASFLFEDLLDLDRSAKLTNRIREGRSVVNAANRTTGVRARRGDGTFGEIVPDVKTIIVPGFSVRRGPVASLEVGAETKILAKAMIKQIDRVIGDLHRQVEQFKRSNPRAICVGVVGINWAAQYRSFEGTRKFLTDGRKYKHPIQEAADALDRLDRHARPVFDEFVVLSFRATNHPPYPFEWTQEAETKMPYGASLARISSSYEARF